MLINSFFLADKTPKAFTLITNNFDSSSFKPKQVKFESRLKVIPDAIAVISAEFRLGSKRIYIFEETIKRT